MTGPNAAAEQDERDKICWCTHSGHDHDAGECWAEVDTPAGRGQCACNWWEPLESVSAAPPPMPVPQEPDR